CGAWRTRRAGACADLAGRYRHRPNAYSRRYRQGRGQRALIYSERKIIDKATGTLLATINQTTFCRADGGFGGAKREAPAPHPIPARAPDIVCDLPTRPETALIYRLSGDVNPLHADPAF